ncbi:MAG TPA: winged helix-turn-helix domain-containing protein [Stellaceae bacterium]|nr:winged helix-turn-helix domain-containing protein [Stellaceae bacterium]
MRSEADAAYKFDRFILHVERGALLADGVGRALRPKSFALLRHFVENPGRPIDRDEIMDAVWPEIFVSDDSIAQCVRDIRRALDDGEHQLLRTLPRRGYLLTAQVTPEPGQPVAPPPLPDKPSIAVLPFQNMSGDPAQEYFVDGMVEEIITALSRIRWLFVIARNSSFTYKGQSPDVGRAPDGPGAEGVNRRKVTFGSDFCPAREPHSVEADLRASVARSAARRRRCSLGSLPTLIRNIALPDRAMVGQRPAE